MNSMKLYKLSLIITTFFVLAAAMPFRVGAAAENEMPEAVYTGSGNAVAILRNLDYQDVAKSKTWAREAIYEAGALDILKGFGAKQFGLTRTMSKEEVIAAVYRAAGREAEAQKAGEALNAARPAANRKTDAIGIWMDGYLQLAANDGLISKRDFADATSAAGTAVNAAGTATSLAGTTTTSAGAPTNKAGTATTSSGFNRKAPAKRQEAAFWLASVLKLPPVYGQQKIFNSYSDWKRADPSKIPYIEAVLQYNIMSGSTDGKFSPLSDITREQFAQIIKNASDYYLPLLKCDIKLGTIEDIKQSSDNSSGKNFMRKIFQVRNSGTQLHQLVAEAVTAPSASGKNEKNGKYIPAVEKEFVVYKNGKVGGSSLLKVGDRIEYTVDSGKVLRFITVISGSETKYICARIKNIDTAARNITAYQLFKLDYPDISKSKNTINFDLNSTNNEVVYKYMKGLAVTDGSKRTDLQTLSPGTAVILTIVNNLINEVKTVELGGDTEEGGVVEGIVEDNNPRLGYITLYSENGSGNDSGSFQDLNHLRTFNYSGKKNIPIYKNHKKAAIEDIETGDSVFLNIDANGSVLSISAADNYTVRYAKIIYKSPEAISVRYGNGDEQVLKTSSSTVIINESGIIEYSALKDGDNVKLLMNVTGKSSMVKEIIIEDSGHYIKSICKGKVAGINDISGRISVWNLEMFENGRWVKTGQKLYSEIKLAAKYSIYLGNRKLDIDDVNKTLKDREAYIALEQGSGGEGGAVMLSFRGAGDAEVLLGGNAAGVGDEVGVFGLEENAGSVRYNEGCIVVKDGRLVTGRSIADGDSLYAAVNRNGTDGDYYAGIVQIRQESGKLAPEIYRGRIKQIEEGNSFTLEFFSILNGLNWIPYMTPKSFNLTSGTVILADSGVIGRRDFLDYGSQSYAGQVVYVAALDIDALIVSTAPYGTYSARGVVSATTGMSIGEDGDVMQEPTAINIRKAGIYDPVKTLWTDTGDMNIAILKNTIILKEGSQIKPSALKKGDSVRIIKKQNDTSGDAYIIFVE